MDEKFSQILENVAELYMKYGMKSVTMDDICRHLGISKKTLYEYVSDKEELIENVMQAPFPFVESSMGIDDVSKKLTRENQAVLVKDEDGKVHIITKHDIIEAIG